MPVIETVEEAVEARLEGGILYSLTEHDKAYLAGLFDGEGYCGVEREERKDRGNKIRFRVVLSVSNTDKQCVDIMRAMTGHGFIAPVNRNLIKHPEQSAWRPLYQWKCKGGSAVHILKVMFPYLRIKAPQASVLLVEGANEGSWLAVKALNTRGILEGRDYVADI